MIVFDLDDTLYKEREYVLSAYRAIASNLASRGLIEAGEALSILESSPNGALGIDRIIDAVNNHNSEANLSVGTILQIYRNHIPDITLPPESLAILQELKLRGIPMGIITDGRSSTQRLKINALRLSDFISPKNILISEEVGADKHSPLMFEQMKAINPFERKFFYVGDNPAKDFRWPNSLGWTSIMLLDNMGINIHPQHPLPSDPTLLPLHTVSKLSEILQLI